jgi:hypothetical protein
VLSKELLLEKVRNIRNMPYARFENSANFNSVTTTSSFIYHYLYLGASVHAHFVLRGRGRSKSGQVDISNLCALFKRAPSGIDWNIDEIPVVEGARNISSPKMLSHDHKYAVFVDDVEFVNDPKTAVAGVFPSRISSLVRLQLLDACECFRRQQVLGHLSKLDEVGLTNADREVGSVATRNIVPVQDGQLANDMVESGTEIVDGIADRQCPNRVIGSQLRLNEQHFLPLRLVFRDERAIFFFRSSPLVDCDLKLIAVVLCTVDLASNSDEICDHE